MFKEDFSKSSQEYAVLDTIAKSALLARRAETRWWVTVLVSSSKAGCVIALFQPPNSRFVELGVAVGCFPSDRWVQQKPMGDSPGFAQSLHVFPHWTRPS
jgi:hypothetical protein